MAPAVTEETLEGYGHLRDGGSGEWRHGVSCDYLQGAHMLQEIDGFQQQIFQALYRYVKQNRYHDADAD